MQYMFTAYTCLHSWRPRRTCALHNDSSSGMETREATRIPIVSPTYNGVRDMLLNILQDLHLHSQFGTRALVLAEHLL